MGRCHLCDPCFVNWFTVLFAGMLFRGSEDFPAILIFLFMHRVNVKANEWNR
jgi:hypothetical protein